MHLTLDHIAVVTRCLEDTAKNLPDNCLRHAVETFPSEGTKEQYIDLGETPAPSLLLLEAIAEGPYQKTLQKRGPGLHHFGCYTDKLQSAIDHFSKNGLLLHPISLQTLKKKTVWLCRPGIPFLVELSETKTPATEPQTRLEMEIPKLANDISWIPGLRLSKAPNQALTIHFASTHLIITP